MNFRSFHKNLASAALAGLTIIALPASAQTDFRSLPSTSPANSFGGGSLSSSGNFGGSAGGFVRRGVGEVKVDSTGYLQLEGTMNGASNGCPQGCGQTNSTFRGLVGQRTVVEGVAGGPGGAHLSTYGNGTANIMFRFAP